MIATCHDATALVSPFHLPPPLTITSKMMTPPTQFLPASPPPRAGASTTASTCGVSVPKRPAALQSSTSARLKRGRKVNTTSECRRPREDADERPARGDSRAIISSPSSIASGSMPSSCARMVWTCSTSVLWDASCGAFSLPIRLRVEADTRRRFLDCTPAWTRHGPRTSQSPSRPRRSRCCARTPRCGASATRASCARFMYVVRWSLVVMAARSCSRARGRLLGRCWRGFRGRGE